MKRLFHLLCTMTLAILAAADARAVTIPTVPVGNAGNAADTTGFGAVSYDYRIGTTEVTNAQYVDFLNAVAHTDTYGLYDALMGASPSGGIIRTGLSPNYSYSLKLQTGAYTYADKPVNYVSWYDALRFANWLNNGQPSGLQDASTTESGTYTFSGATSVGARNSDATWFMASENEWYKAAYYDPRSAAQGGPPADSHYWLYPTGTNTPPNNHVPTSDTGNSANFFDNGYSTGDSEHPLTDAGAYMQSPSPHDTFDQGGNVYEWDDTLQVGFFPWDVRGGAWGSSASYLSSSNQLNTDPINATDYIGFRVATVPEPSTFALAGLGIIGLLVVRKRHRASMDIGSVMAGAVMFVSPAQAAQYNVTYMGTLGGTSSYASGINDAGHVTGYSNTWGDAATVAFLYDGALHGLGISAGTGINNIGQVVGYHRAGNGARRAFVYDNGTMHDIGTLGGSESIANGISEFFVVGVSDTAENRTHAFFFDGRMHDLGTLGGSIAWALAVNDAGQVTGWSSTPDGLHHAFLYDGTMHDLGTLNGPYSYGYAINTAGHVAGYSSAVPSNSIRHAFLYDGTMHDLGTLGGSESYGRGINDAGQVTGTSDISGNAAQHAFIYDSVHGMRDLNSLIDPNTGWTLTSATDINNVGQIVGYASRIVVLEDESWRFEDTAFLLTPVPEPSTFALAALCILGLLVVRKRRLSNEFLPRLWSTCRLPGERPARDRMQGLARLQSAWSSRQQRPSAWARLAKRGR